MQNVCDILVILFRIALSMAPVVSSPPWICAIGILLNVAATTEEKISYLSPNTNIKLGLIF